MSDNFSDYSGNSGLDEEDDDFDEKNELGKGKTYRTIVISITSAH